MTLKLRMQKITIEIDKDLKKMLPHIKLGCIICDVRYEESNSLLTETLETFIGDIKGKVALEEVSKLDNIFHTREAYKVLGKKPGRYRPSAEALHRRIIRELGLYKLNNIVDVTNLISLKTRFSIGTYDMSKIGSKIIATVGKEGDSYEGIRKEELNICNLPVLADDKGKFGNPCSDSKRAMIDKNTKQILMLIWSFSEDSNLASAIEYAVDSLAKFCYASNIEFFVEQ